MSAWRTSAKGISGNASAVPIAFGSSDGGESGAGERLSRLLELTQCEDVVLVVYRWYGGVKLGSHRWKCISAVAKEALERGGFTGAREKGKNSKQARSQHVSASIPVGYDKKPPEEAGSVQVRHLKDCVGCSTLGHIVCRSRIVKTIQTEYFSSGGATILTCTMRTSMPGGASAVIPFCKQSAMPENMVLPPDRTMLPYKSQRTSKSHFVIGVYLVMFPLN
ncbi:hypothetical protein AcV5_003033 [Taiwanofungus camphoratus]|nr:hypothetical protein AcV5_003033 [Antrodia cinnamomea]